MSSSSIFRDKNLDQSFFFSQHSVLISSNFIYILLSLFFFLSFSFDLDVEGVVIIDVFSIISALYVLLSKQVFLFVLLTKNFLVSTIFNYMHFFQQLCISSFFSILQMKFEFFFWKFLNKTWVLFSFYEFYKIKYSMSFLFLNEIFNFFFGFNKEFNTLNQYLLFILDSYFISFFCVEVLYLYVMNEDLLSSNFSSQNTRQSWLN